MTEDLDVLKDRVERLRSLHLRALGSYHAYVQMKQFLAPNVVGEDQARKNAEAFGRYTGYLSVVRNALETEVYLSVAKIYDHHKDALHIRSLFKYAVAKNKALTAAQQESLDDPDAAEELAHVYEGLTPKECRDISSDLEAADDKIKRLKAIRDKILAHEDLKGSEDIEGLSFDDLSYLMDLHEKIVNTISLKYLGNTVLVSFYRDQVIADSKNLFRLIANDYDAFRSQL
jgi:hypothetical protein